MKSKYFIFCCACLFFAIVVTACGDTKKEPKPVCPFTDIGWEASVEEVISAESGEFSTYDSVYGGICYNFTKEFEGREGTVKYMFDEKERLLCMAWACSCKDDEELLSLYETINSSVNSLYGESGYSADHPGNYGNVWYLEEGDIVLTTMNTSELKALQYAYLHPLVSNRESASGSES